MSFFGFAQFYFSPRPSIFKFKAFYGGYIYSNNYVIIPQNLYVIIICPYDFGIQCPLDIATLYIAAALPIATSIPVTNLRQYINSDLGYNDFKFQFFVLK